MSRAVRSWALSTSRIMLSHLLVFLSQENQEDLCSCPLHIPITDNLAFG